MILVEKPPEVVVEDPQEEPRRPKVKEGSEDTAGQAQEGGDLFDPEREGITPDHNGYFETKTYSNDRANPENSFQEKYPELWRKYKIQNGIEPSSDPWPGTHFIAATEVYVDNEGPETYFFDLAIKYGEEDRIGEIDSSSFPEKDFFLYQGKNEQGGDVFSLVTLGELVAKLPNPDDVAGYEVSVCGKGCVALSKNEGHGIERTEVFSFDVSTESWFHQETIKGDQELCGVDNNTVYQFNESGVQIYHPDRPQGSRWFQAVSAEELEENGISRDNPNFIDVSVTPHGRVFVTKLEFDGSFHLLIAEDGRVTDVVEFGSEGNTAVKNGVKIIADTYFESGRRVNSQVISKSTTLVDLWGPTKEGSNHLLLRVRDGKITSISVLSINDGELGEYGLSTANISPNEFLKPGKFEGGLGGGKWWFKIGDTIRLLPFTQDGDLTREPSLGGDPIEIQNRDLSNATALQNMLEETTGTEIEALKRDHEAQAQKPVKPPKPTFLRH